MLLIGRQSIFLHFRYFSYYGISDIVDFFIISYISSYLDICSGFFCILLVIINGSTAVLQKQCYQLKSWKIN